jgi:hypothetical protein
VWVGVEWWGRRNLGVCHVIDGSRFILWDEGDSHEKDIDAFLLYVGGYDIFILNVSLGKILIYLFRPLKQFIGAYYKAFVQ